MFWTLIFSGRRAVSGRSRGYAAIRAFIEAREGVDHVRLPGDPERETMADRLRNGIPIDDGSLKDICDAAEKAGMTGGDINAWIAG